MNFNINRYSLTLKLILFISPILFILGLVIPYILGVKSYSIYSLYITIPLIFAVSIFYLIRDKSDIMYNIETKYASSFDLFYILIYCLSIATLLFYEIRINLYFIFMGLLFITILIKILFVGDLKDNKYLILFQIILFFLNLIYGITLKYPQYIGRGDTMYHSWFFTTFLDNGWTDENISSAYSKFPLWHLFVSAVTLITKMDIDTHKIMFLCNGIINSSIIIISYYISKTLFKKEKIALLTSLLLCIFPNFIIVTTQSLPRGINGSLNVAVLFLLLNSDKIAYKTLSIFIGLSMILFHHASMISILFIYSIIFILQFFYNMKKTESIVNLRFMIIILLSIIGYWVSYSNFLLTNIFGSLTPESASSISIYTPSGIQITEILNYVQFSPYIFLSTIGILAMLWLALHEDRVIILGVTGFGLLALSIPNPLASIGSVFTRLIFNRLMEYTSALVLIITSYGLFYVSNKLNKKMKILFIAFMFITCIFSIKNDFTASDNPLFKREFYTFYLTAHEISSIETLCRISNEGYLMSDYQVWRFIVHSRYSEKGHLLEVDFNKSMFFKERDVDLIIIREGELEKRSLNIFATSEYIRNPAWVEGRFYYCYSDDEVFDTLNAYNRNYDNGEVVTYN